VTGNGDVPTFVVLQETQGTLQFANEHTSDVFDALPPVPSDSDAVRFLYISWLEMHAARVLAGAYAVRRPAKGRYLSLFNRLEESVAVTNHVRVAFAAHFLPARSNDVLSFTYTILLELQPTVRSVGFLECRRIIHRCFIQAAFEWCQLKRRHWIIKSNGQPPEEVDGEGVIGEFPILSRSNPSFQYEVFPAYVPYVRKIGMVTLSIAAYSP
jgi:F-box protein 3